MIIEEIWPQQEIITFAKDGTNKAHINTQLQKKDTPMVVWRRIIVEIQKTKKNLQQLGVTQQTKPRDGITVTFHNPQNAKMRVIQTINKESGMIVAYAIALHGHGATLESGNVEEMMNVGPNKLRSG